MTRLCLLGLVLPGLLLFCPVVPAAEGCDDLAGGRLLPDVRWPEVWAALDQGASCTQNCHLGSAPAGDLDLSNARLAIYFLVGQPSAQDGITPRVLPGAPTRSLLLQKVACREPDVGGPMPPPSGHLPRELRALIHDWIEQGALGESREDPIPRQFVFRDSMESFRCVAEGVTLDHHACIGITAVWRGARP